MQGTYIDARPKAHSKAQRNRRLARWMALGAAVLSLGSPLAAPAAHAYTSAPLTGTFTETFVPVNVRVVGDYTFLTLQNTGVFTGTLSGTSNETATAIVYPDGTTVIVSTGVCQCTFAGRSGPVRFVAQATVLPDGSVSGQAVFTGLPGGLSGLAGTAQFEGFGNVINLTGRLILP